MDTELIQLQEKIEDRLAAEQPDVELLTLERPAAERLRLVIDRPSGVDIALCESVTGSLRELLEDWSLEVSSPGPERPLTKPEHYRQFLGNKVRVKTSEEIAGRQSFTGTLTAADEEQLSLEAPDGAVSIPLQSVRRSNLVPEEEVA
ncbi:MAG: ribosome maturation factor RimP [Gaiellaceae bacterium]